MPCRVSAADPHPVEPPEDTDLPGPTPQSASEKDTVSPREKHKMKDTLDDFLNRTD